MRHIYGTATVTLLLMALCIVMLAGCEENEYHNSPTDPDGPPTAAFAAFEWNYLSQNQISCRGQGCGVQFFDRSTNAKRWQWNFGDGGSSNLRDPLHFYREENCGRNANCQFIINLAVCPEQGLRFDDERCSQAVNVVTVPPPS